MWKLLTSIQAKEPGIVRLLESIDGNAKTKKAVSELTAAELNVENGLNLLLEKLDKVFQEETIDEAYNIYSSFINLSKCEDMSINEYIIESEHLNKKMIQNQMKLPNIVLTFKLFHGPNITSEERKLALTLCSDLDFDKMKSALERLFTTSSNHSHSQDNIVAIKQEQTFFNKKCKKSNDKANPLGKNGKISRCIICNSKLHWVKKCPHRSSQNVNIVEEDLKQKSVILS